MNVFGGKGKEHCSVLLSVREVCGTKLRKQEEISPSEGLLATPAIKQDATHKALCGHRVGAN